jgi:transcriptional regulator with XRE-family HTH domain
MAARTIGSEVSQRLMATVRAIRRQRGWSAEELGLRCTDAGYPISRSIIASLETRAGLNVAVEMLVAFATAFGMKPGDLLDLEFCQTCAGAPPAGFQCTACGVTSR